MIIVVPTLLIGVMALYGMDALSKENNWKEVFTKYKTSFIVLGFVLGSVLYIYMSSDFKSPEDLQKLSQWNNIVNAQIKDPAAAAQYTTPANDLINAVASDRKGLIEGDLLKALLYILAIGVLLFLAFKKVINQTILFIAFGVLAMVDLFQLDLKYLKPDHFIEATENENAFALSPLDNALLKDKSDFRVLDLRSGIQNSFNGGAIIAYHHKTVGGYNPAKLSIYQDLIENQWYKFPNCMPTMNMMNTKYIITGDLSRDTIPNPNACGSVWFVKGIDYRKTPADVMNQLSFFNPKDTAVIEEKDKIEDLKNISFDNNASIKLVNNDNDLVNYTSNSATKQLAIFSEVYYKLGWKAYIDNKETPIIKANYVLRGLVIPAGNHQIRFEFKPSSIESAQMASKSVSWILWGILLGLLAKTLITNKAKD